jgi:hypothetical protein
MPARWWRGTGPASPARRRLGLTPPPATPTMLAAADTAHALVGDCLRVGPGRRPPACRRRQPGQGRCMDIRRHRWTEGALTLRDDRGPSSAASPSASTPTSPNSRVPRVPAPANPHTSWVRALSCLERIPVASGVSASARAKARRSDSVFGAACRKKPRHRSGPFFGRRTRRHHPKATRPLVSQINRGGFHGEGASRAAADVVGLAD